MKPVLAKVILSAVLMTALLTLTACGRTKYIDHPKATMTGEGVMVEEEYEDEELSESEEETEITEITEE
ncbi:MAG: hypothetical protein ACI4JJ_04910 [Huintestinicola sp.]